MKERGICMSGPMVLALKAGRKTVTRRIVKRQHVLAETLSADPRSPTGFAWSNGWVERCRYVPGDLLYIREACWMWGAWRKNGLTKTGRQRWRFRPRGLCVVYERPQVTAKRDGSIGWVYRHARYMPKKCARTWLEVTDVRVQQVQGLDNNEALAEGTPDIRTIDNNFDMRDCFGVLWDDIHGPGAWERNNWCWALSFELIEKETAK